MSYFIFLKKHYFETKENVGNGVWGRGGPAVNHQIC
jgi:hypothetical protein